MLGCLHMMNRQTHIDNILVEAFEDVILAPLFSLHVVWIGFLFICLVRYICMYLYLYPLVGTADLRQSEILRLSPL